MSMSSRLVLWLIGVASALLVVICGLHYRTSSMRIAQDHRDLLESLSSRLCTTLRGPVFGFDEHTAQDILRAELDSPHVVAIGVWASGRTRPMAAVSREGTAVRDQWPETLPAGHIQSERPLAAPAASGGAAIGRVVVMLDPSLAYRQMRRHLMDQVLQQAFLVAILVCLLAVVLQKLLLDPLETIRQSMLAVEAAARSPEANVEPSPPPLHSHLSRSFQELRDIATAHESMVLALARNNQALRRGEEELRITLDSIADAIIATCASGRILRVNAAAESLLGRSRADACGQRLAELLPLRNPAQDKPLANFPLILLSPDVPRPLRATLPPSTPGRATCVLDLMGAPLPRAPGEAPGCVIVLRDVTKQVAIEEQLRQSQKMESIGQLAGGIAHDFNNQLSGVLGFAEILCEQLEDPAQRKYADNIMTAALRAADLTRQLLAYSRKGKYQSIPVDVHKVLDEVMGLLNRSIDKRIELRPQMEAQHPVVRGDPTQLQNALLNLALNARDAMPQGGQLGFHTRIVTLSTTFPGDDLPPGRYIRIDISDTGVGMSSEVKQRLFEPFFTTKEIGKGTGLGLASVYGTVKNHGGSIRVQSEPGQGSTFSLFLPLLEQPLNALPATGTPAPTPRREGNILIVDDEPVILELGTAILNSAGYKTSTCRDPEQAVAQYKTEWKSVDLVILDMNMPKLNGRQLYEEMRRINPQIKAILASGFSLSGDTQGIRDLGILGFVAKPFQRRELIDSVTEALAR
jgi:PAS domain S-box-containing protein